MLYISLAQPTSIGDGELRDNRARVKDCTVHGNVVPVHLLENAPILEAAVKGFMARPGRRLHPQILGGVAVIVRTFHLVRAANVAVVGLDALAWLEEVREDVVKDLDVHPSAGRVGSRDPHQIPGKDVNPELVSERGLARILVGAKEVPLLCNPLLLDAVVGTVDCHQTIISLVVFETAFKHNLRFREGGGDKK